MHNLWALFSASSRYLKSSVDRFLFSFTQRLGTFIEIVLSVLGFLAGAAYLRKYISASAGEIDTPDVLALLAFLLTICSVLALCHAIAEVIGLLRFNLSLRGPNANIQARMVAAYQEKEQQSSVKTIVAGTQSFVYDTEVCRLLDGAQNPVVVAKSRYTLPGPLHKFRGHLLKIAPGVNATTTNDLKVRLLTTPSENALRNNTPICIQKTDYFSDRLTNHLFDKEIFYNTLPILKLVEWNTDRDGTFKDFESSPFSNQLGGSCLLITSDHKIVYVEQGKGAAENPLRLAPSGSGSFDWDDFREARNREGNQTFQDLAKKALFRELREEVGLPAQLNECLQILVGIGRYIYRGGKPEIFSIVFTKKRFHELKVRPAEWDFIFPDIKAFEIGAPLDRASVSAGIQRFMQFCQACEENASGPLWFNCELANRYLESSPTIDKQITDFFSS